MLNALRNEAFVGWEDRANVLLERREDDDKHQ